MLRVSESFKRSRVMVGLGDKPSHSGQLNSSSKYGAFWGESKQIQQTSEEDRNNGDGNNFNFKDMVLLPEEESFRIKVFRLLFCFLGLMASYVTWGFSQEMLMTHKYETGNFKSTVFLVFANKSLALILSGSIVIYNSGISRNSLFEGSFYHCFPCSLSNFVSSWAQYECLKYVSFPTQTIFKSFKIIPVMLMGKYFHKKSYLWIDYFEAIAIAFGITFFMLTERRPVRSMSENDSILGVIILNLYLFSDSFTAQWQDRIFKKYHVDQYKMMFGVNLWSFLFCAIKLLSTSEISTTSQFFIDNPQALIDVSTLAITSAIGQLFIFYTIKQFGPVVFTIMMTTRQVFSLVISCIFFGHTFSLMAILGTLLVFGPILYRSVRKYNESYRKKI